MTASQFSSFSSGGFLQYVATFSANKGQGAPTSVDWTLQQGEYYLVVANPFPIQSTFETSTGIYFGTQATSGSVPEFPPNLGLATLVTIVVVAGYVIMWGSDHRAKSGHGNIQHHPL